jgi:hypothetical protein
VNYERFLILMIVILSTLLALYTVAIIVALAQLTR